MDVADIECELIPMISFESHAVDFGYLLHETRC